MEFKLESPFEPTGDQPEAIRQIVQGIEDNESAQVLLGVTGHGARAGCHSSCLRGGLDPASPRGVGQPQQSGTIRGVGGRVRGRGSGRAAQGGRSAPGDAVAGFGRLPFAPHGGRSG